MPSDSSPDDFSFFIFFFCDLKENKIFKHQNEEEQQVLPTSVTEKSQKKKRVSGVGKKTPGNERGTPRHLMEDGMTALRPGSHPCLSFSFLSLDDFAHQSKNITSNII